MSRLTPEQSARIAADAAIRLAGGQHPHGTEADLVRLFLEQEECGHHEERLGTTPHDTFIREFRFQFGRADLIAFHVDGGATVIEAKDGTCGYTHVVAGIGQAGLYAAQLSLTHGALKRVRKALLWSSTGDKALDALIELACLQAGVIPLPTATMRCLMANGAAVRAEFEATP